MPADPKLAAVVELARADLAKNLGINPDTITVREATAVEWPNPGLGCPQRGVFYIQVITPGYKILLEANGKVYDYRSDGKRIVLCEQ